MDDTPTVKEAILTLSQVISDGLYALTESIGQHTVELQRLRRELAEARKSNARVWLPLQGGDA